MSIRGRSFLPRTQMRIEGAIPIRAAIGSFWLCVGGGSFTFGELTAIGVGSQYRVQSHNTQKSGTGELSRDHRIDL